MANRSRTEIVGQILEAVYDSEADEDGSGEGITRTKIMYTAYLSSAQLKEYLLVLTVHGLLIFDSAMHRYNITEKGLRYLELYNKLGDVMKGKEEEEKEQS